MKVMAMSKDFFACGWNIFDLIIVSASLLDLIFELVDGLSVLRGLRLVSHLKENRFKIVYICRMLWTKISTNLVKTKMIIII